MYVLREKNRQNFVNDFQIYHKKSFHVLFTAIKQKYVRTAPEYNFM